MKNIIFGFIFLSGGLVNAQTPKDYSCNEHVKYSMDTLNGQYRITYTFKDQREILRTFKFNFEVAKTMKDIARYGVPKSYFENISATQQFSKGKKKTIKKGFYKLTGNFLKTDRSELVSYYRLYCKAIAGGIIYTLLNEGCDNRANRIEMAMKFVQDIPYGIPQIKDTTWEVYGIYTPPEVLIRMYGDCDSKAILCVSILSYLINIKDVLFLYQGHDHALIAIKGTPTTKQKYIEINKIKYIIADVTGPDRLDLGDDGNKFDASVGYKVEKIKVKRYWWHDV